MTSATPLNEAADAVRAAKAHYDKILLAIPEQTPALSNPSALAPEYSTAIAIALHELRARITMYHAHVQHRLHALNPDRYPNPNLQPGEHEITWTRLPIHETEPEA